MKQQHETFVQAMAEHNDPIKAYLAAYPNAKESSARSAAYRLLQNPEINKAVTFDAKHMHKKAKAAAIKKGAKRLTQQLADIQKRREVLAQMIFGALKRKRFFKLDGEIIWVEDDIPSQSVLRAIELDCKLEAGFDWAGRRPAEKKKKEEQEETKPEDPTGVIILCGDTLFASEDAAWIERYIAWKKANPEKVKEWAENEGSRADYFIDWPEDVEGLPGNRNTRRIGTRSIIQIMRFSNGRPAGPFIPGESRYFTNYNDEHAFYGTKPFHAPAPKLEPEIQQDDKQPSPLSPSRGGHSAEGRIGGGLNNIGQTTQQNQLPGQQNATIQLPSNPPLPAHMPQNRKVYHNSDELWEAYKAALPAWPHLAEKTRRFMEQRFRNNTMSGQRQLLRLKLGDMDDKNSAA